MLLKKVLQRFVDGTKSIIQNKTKTTRVLYTSSCESNTEDVYEQLLRKAYLLPENGHNVLIIQPNVKYRNLQKYFQNSSFLTKTGPSEEEALALVDSLDCWETVAIINCNLNSPIIHKERFFTKGVWDSLTTAVVSWRDGKQIDRLPIQSNLRVIKKNERITAVFINWSRLSTHQLTWLQYAWHLPVYDRYTLVIQLFSLRARSQEAKAQAQLAEIGLLRARLPAFFHSINKIGELCENRIHLPLSKERLVQLINERETRLLTTLETINSRRNQKRKLRHRNTQYQLPHVTVVGYTNAGKTSVIKYLSGSSKLSSSPQVFATLDVTHHRARLATNSVNNSDSDDGTPSIGPTEICDRIGLPGLQILLLDTIGFMSDLPTNLVAAFRATLDECLDTDLVLHVVDVSQPEWKLCIMHVERLLKDAGLLVDEQKPKEHILTTSRLDNNSLNNVSEKNPKVLRIGNKIDLITDYETNNELMDFNALISTKNGIGMDKLMQQIESYLLQHLNWFHQTVKVNQSSNILEWLYSNTMVTNVSVTETTSEYLNVTAIFTPISWNRMCKLFSVNSCGFISENS